MASDLQPISSATEGLQNIRQGGKIDKGFSLPVWPILESNERQGAIMNMNKILVPLDFSHSGEAALRYATSLARDSGASLLLIHVEETPLAYGAGEFYAGAADAETSEELTARLVAITPADSQVPYSHRLLHGDAAAAILHVAEEEQADLIVMGTHGHTGLLRLLMGSVAETVVRQAPCPVFTLRDTVEAESKA